MSSMNAKTKQVVKIILLFVASGFFLYQGFALLYEEQPAAREVVNVSK